jgi:hypothetical protein
VNLPRVDLRQRSIEIGWDVQRPSYTFVPAKTNIAIDPENTEVVIHRTPPRLTIDQSQCWADMDLKSAFRRIAEAAEDGKQAAFSFIARKMNEGRKLKEIESDEAVVKRIAENKRTWPQYRFEYGNVPGNFSLHFGIIPGEFSMDWKPHRIEVDVRSYPYRQEYEKGKIDYYIKQKQYLTIDVVGGTFDVSY